MNGLTSAQAQTLVVTGVSGNLGRLIVVRLRALHAGPIIATTRSPEKLSDLAASGIEVRGADFDEPSTLDRAFKDGHRLLIVSTDAHDVPGRRLQQHRNAIAAAQRSTTMQHVVYTSLTRPEPGSPMKIAPDHYQTEQALIDSSLAWTILRNNLYADLLLEFLPPAVRSGRLFSAAGDGAIGWVTRDDAARAAAGALHSAGNERRVIDITGPGVVSYAEIAKIAAEVTGHPIEYIAAPAESIADGMAKAGLPRHVVEVLLGFQLATARSDLAIVTPAVRLLTGLEPQSVRDFLFANAARLRKLASPAT